MRLKPTKMSFFRAEIEKFFVRFLVQVKMAKSPFEINWPLKKKRKYVLRKTWPKSKKFWTQIASENSSSAPCWLWLLKKPKIWKLKSKRQSKLVFWTSEALKHRISPSMVNLIAKNLQLHTSFFCWSVPLHTSHSTLISLINVEGYKICQITKRGAWNKHGGWDLVEKTNA